MQELRGWPCPSHFRSPGTFHDRLKSTLMLHLAPEECLLFLLGGKGPTTGLAFVKLFSVGGCDGPCGWQWC